MFLFQMMVCDLKAVINIYKLTVKFLCISWAKFKSKTVEFFMPLCYNIWCNKVQILSTKKERIFLKLRRLFSLLLSVLIIASTASVCLITTTSAAETETVETGAKLGTYYNVDYLEAEAKAYLDTQKDMSETNLGATYTPQATTWRVWSPTATKVQLKLYTTGSDMESGAALIGKYEMTKDAKTSVWSYTLNGDQKDVYYTYLITNPNGTKETFDIYAKAAGVNGDRSMVVDLDSTDPDGWNNDKHVFPENMTDEALWEVHVADLTSNDNSGVDKNYQGKFLGFAEGGLTLNGKSVGIDYLVEQGIKAVHIQCPFDFASGDETNPLSYNWGYDPKNYNLPEGMYSTNPYDGNVRINEFKQLIQALHDRGITVIMGVVYNHTYVTEQSAFSYTVPGYYYRMSSGTFYINGTGCGNTLASDKAMFRSYMLNSLKYWVEEYHIDGFRFDLMACHDTETMNMIRDMFNGMLDGEGKKIIMYGEPWTGGASSGLTGTYESSTPNFGKLSANIAGFSDQVRNSIQSVFTGSGSISASKDGIKGGSMGKYPNQSINYFDCHDGATWWDRIVGKDFDSTSATNTAKLRTSFTFLWTSQGIPFTLAGTEFARTKYGHTDSYNLGDVNAFDWERIHTYANEVAYAKGMREIRSAFSPFREADTRNVPEYLTTSNATNILAYTRNNTKAGEWSKAVVVLNNGADAGTVTLPAGTWTIVANGDKAGLTSLGTATGTYNVGAYGSAVLVQGTTSAKTAEFETITVNHYVGEELLKSSEIKYEVGTTWRATPDAYTIFDHSVTKIENNAGTKDGNCVYGTVEKGQDVVVSFYYKQETTSGYLTVKYVNEAGESISSDVTYRLKNGSEYNVPFENIAGFELVSAKYPNNFKGTFDAANPATISFVYKQIASDKITVYYYDALGAGNGLNLRMYAYTEQMDESTGDVEKPIGNWNVKGQNMKKVTDVSELPEGEELGNWYKYVIDDSTVVMKDENGNPRKFASCKVMFLLSNNSKQEPLNGEAGYDASGTIYVKNKIVTFDSKIITSHIDAETGKKLGDDVVKEYNNVTSNEVYLTSPIAKYGKAETPTNASGNLTAGTTCVVYMYKENGEVTGVFGSVDGDDVVNVKDATAIQKAVAGLDLAYYDESLADVDENGTVNVKDATYIQKWVAGIITDDNIGKGTTGGDQGGDDDTKTKLTTLYTEASALLKEKADYVTENVLGADELALKKEFGFVIADEDSTKNEYQKFNAVLTSVSFYVVNGGTDEEIKAALETLEKANDWFKHYVTEVHPEPVGDVDPYAIDVSNGQYPIIDGYYTVVFSTTWNTASIYSWGGSAGETAGWPGVAMKYALTNDYGEKQYVGYVPSGCTNYIISGDGGQTVDLELTGNVGMYMDKMSAGKYTIGTWEPNFYEYK